MLKEDTQGCPTSYIKKNKVEFVEDSYAVREINGNKLTYSH